MWYIVIGLILIAMAIAKVISENHGYSEPIETINKKQLGGFKQKELLTETEKKFYKVLKKICADKEYDVFIKIRLADIIDNDEHKDFNKIKSKHVDFLLYNEETIDTLLIIELDDTTHKQSSRKDRDKIVDEILKSANIPILHMPVYREYFEDRISEMISEHINSKKEKV